MYNGLTNKGGTLPPVGGGPCKFTPLSGVDLQGLFLWEKKEKIMKESKDRISQGDIPRATSRENPFSSAMSGYGRVEGGRLVSVFPEGSPEHDFHIQAHEKFRELVLNPRFVCIGAQAAVRPGHYVLGGYSDMSSSEVAEGVCHDMVRYMREFPFAEPFYTFAACFKEPKILSEEQGIRNFYTLLSNMHSVDARHFKRSDDFSSDVQSPDFNFSIGGEGFFVPFLSAFPGHDERKTDLNLVIFNNHKMFEKLRSTGAFDPLRDSIRRRMNPPLHPFLADHGEGLVFPQFALPSLESITLEKEIRQEVLGSCPFHSAPEI